MDDERVGMPRWVKISIGVAVAVALVLVVVLLVGQGHGPGRHFGGHGGSGAAVPR